MFLRLLEKIGDVNSKNILIFVGMGNNGGDGQVMARHLVGHNAKVTVVLLGTPEKIKNEETFLVCHVLVMFVLRFKLLGQRMVRGVAKCPSRNRGKQKGYYI